MVKRLNTNPPKTQKDPRYGPKSGSETQKSCFSGFQQKPQKMTFFAKNTKKHPKNDVFSRFLTIFDVFLTFLALFPDTPKNPKNGVLGGPPPPPPKKGGLGGGLILREKAHGVVMEGGVNPHFWPFLAIFGHFWGFWGGRGGTPKTPVFCEKT